MMFHRRCQIRWWIHKKCWRGGPLPPLLTFLKMPSPMNCAGAFPGYSDTQRASHKMMFCALLRMAFVHGISYCLTAYDATKHL